MFLWFQILTAKSETYLHNLIWNAIWGWGSHLLFLAKTGFINMYVWHVTGMTSFCSLKLSDVLKRSYGTGSLEKAFSISPTYLYTKDLVRKGKILTQKHSLVFGLFWCTKKANFFLVFIHPNINLRPQCNAMGYRAI